jgi:ketosteroid isomerase-like protein
MAKYDSAHPPTHADLTDAKDLDRRFTEAMSRKDLDAAMACFWNDPDLVVVLWGKVQRGPAAVRAAIKEIFDKNESVRLEINDVIHLPAGDGVIGVGTATYELRPESGPRKLMVERWSDLRRKIDGRWVYVLDHASEMPD